MTYFLGTVDFLQYHLFKGALQDGHNCFFVSYTEEVKAKQFYTNLSAPLLYST